MCVLQQSHRSHLLSKMTVISMQHTVARALFNFCYWCFHNWFRYRCWLNLWLWRTFLNFSFLKSSCASHRWAIIPIVFGTARTVNANNFIRTCVSVYLAPIMHWTLLIIWSSVANSFHRWPLVPIMIFAPWSIFANYSLVATAQSMLA